MITIYKKNAIPKAMELIRLNDIYFNKYTVGKLDDKAKEIVLLIDQSEMINKYMIRSRFDSSDLNIDKLSTGCKTVLNVLYNQDKVFDICECGDNALDVIYSLSSGNVYCDYPFIAFDMERALGCDKQGVHEFDSYEELKEWWTNES